MKQLVKESGEELLGLYRDDSGIIVNKNTNAYDKYKIDRQRILEQMTLTERVTKLENTIASIDSKIDSLLKLLDK